MNTRADLCRQARAIAAPVTIWAMHFVLVYALFSAACAPRMLMDFATLRIVVVVMTALAAVLALLPLVTGHGAEPDLARAARWSGIIATLAILLQALPVLLWQSCG